MLSGLFKASMTERDLTFNAFREEDFQHVPSPYERQHNPFSDGGSVSSQEETSFYNNESTNATTTHLLPGSTTHFLSHESIPSDNYHPISPDTPPPFHSILQSDFGEPYHPENNNPFLPNTNNLGSNSSARDLASEDQNSPFLTNVDYSPFGGYPASSFPLLIEEKEPDDYLHNPDPVADAIYDKNRFWYDLKNLDSKSVGGLIGFVALLVGCLALFVVFPVLTYSGLISPSVPESYEVLTHYSYPLLSAIRTNLVDPDTPEDALYTKTRLGELWKLTFSDEFNVEGRTFYEGDDQFFQGLDSHYAGTQDLEWYDPDAITTANGTLVLKLDAYQNHDLFYRSGMLQSWNKLCFNQGMIQFSARLPGYGSISGLWPGLWTMGNIGRPGYKGSTEGVWPYSYDSCDAGITANQSSPDGISYLPGQRLNACTCQGEDHPNRGTGRGAPEIDIVEASVDSNLKNGVVSHSYQIAPYDIWYMPDYNFVEIHTPDITTANTYTGGPLQQAVSGVTTLNPQWYERGSGAGQYQIYGMEYLNDDDDGYITWYIGVNVMTVHAYAMGPNGNVGFRRILKEPMSIIMNLGISNSWAYIDWAALTFPAYMTIDYVRVYQPENAILMTCDPESHPTYDYIQSHKNLYYNANITTFNEGGYTMPKNRLVNGCK